MAAQKKVSDKVIVNTLKKHKALTQSEIENTLNYSKSSLKPRLQRLVMENKIKSKILPHRSSAGSYVVFRGYTDVLLYYINDDDFIEWIKNRLPKNLPMNLRKVITMKLNEMGINLNLSPRRELKLIAIKPYIHSKLKNMSKRKNKSIQSITEEALLSYID